MSYQQCCETGPNGAGKKKSDVKSDSSKNTSKTSTDTKKTIAQKFKSTASISTSISSVKQKIAETEAKEKEETERKKKLADEKRDRSFTLEDVKRHWNELILLVKREKNHFFISILEDGILEFKAPYTIEFALHNPILKDYFHKLRPILFKFFSEKLHNDLLVFEAKTAQTGTGKKMLYTQQEKLAFLTEKYPALVELKNKLGLDLDG